MSGKAVYNAWGVPVVAVTPALRTGGKPRFDLNVMEIPQPSFDQLIQRPEVKAQIAREMPNSPLEEVRKRYEAQAPKSSVITFGTTPASSERSDALGAPASVIETYPAPMTVEAFLAAVREVGAQTPLPQGGQPASADPSRPFTVKPPSVSALRAAAGQAPPQAADEARLMREGDDLGAVQPTTPAPLQPVTPLAPGRVRPTPLQ
jgi:hypothetical protein